jgi:hypothetical protein
MDSSLMNQSDLQALIAETEALGWDKPDFLVPHDGVLAPNDRFAFVGKLLAQKSHNTSHVRSTLLSVWGFAKPFSMEVLEPNKYLFTVSQESIYQRILDLGPWNVKGSLLLLQPWSSKLAIDEVKLQYCAFWVQVHELPRQFMTTKNAIRIGKTIGDILELDNNNSTGIISRPFIRMKIELNTSRPLASGFYMPCEGTKPRWIGFQYEHLDEYCSLCGLIGHIPKFCSAPPAKRTPEKYMFSLRAPPYVRPCLMPQPLQDDSDSGVSSAASVGNSPTCLSPSCSLESPCSSFGQLVPRNQLDSHASSSNLLNLQHVESPNSLVPSQPNQLLKSWDSFSSQPPSCRYPPKGNSNLISKKAHIFDWPYPTLRDPTSTPLLPQITPTSTQLAPCSSSRNLPLTYPMDIFPAGAYPSLLSHAPGLFDSFLQKWAQNPQNPSLSATTSSTYHLVPSASKSSPPIVEPIIQHPLDHHLNRKLSTHKLSRFRPYDISRPSKAVSTSTFPSQTHTSHSPGNSQISTQTLSESVTLFPPTSSPSPIITQTCPLSFEIPAIISRGKGKSKLVLDEDDVPLVNLKKHKSGQLGLDGSFSDSTDVDRAALSLTKLRDDPLFRGPAHTSQTSSLLVDHGKVVDFMPPRGGGFNLCDLDSNHGSDLNKGFNDALPPAVCGVYSLLQGSHTTWPTSMVETDLMDISHSTIAPASVAVSQGPVMRRFVRASRGRRMMTSPVIMNQPTEVSADRDVLEECPLRPPPQV